MQRGTSRSGFTLLEILVALIILGIGSVSLIALFTIGSVAHRQGMDQAVLNRLSQSILTHLQLTLNTADPQGLKDQAMEGFPPQYRYDAKFTPLDPHRNVFIVEVTIRWQGDKKRELYTFSSILRRRS